MLGWILCKVKGHSWRKAHKNEDRDHKYCKRCPEKVAVKHRKKETS